ncbi:MAG TPA: hypothetical protein VGL65_00830 [Gemmatimonadales bacterium]|jgi:hypothetical protein
MLKLYKRINTCRPPTNDVDTEEYHNIKEIQIEPEGDVVLPGAGTHVWVRGTLGTKQMGPEYTKVVMRVKQIHPSTLLNSRGTGDPR